ncbi:cellulose binding domain-containing protein [Actinospica sp. MGRD01-02]|uniref:Cellulose binding domain-containing protein n=1 Tax=Actinospica acidithermotolerans TaxID=2828514 RepID=A0A941EC73_9ACTN|nr:cellulose binding domain-containing protein [Actinospica acidithermotolerans]MBR7826344.1 cellulose binding domain-containing protein [Actinospica acidithermotolerans]
MTRPLSARLALLAAAALVGAGLSQSAVLTPASAAAAPTADVTVNANEGDGTIPSTGYGLNTAVWDGQMNSATTQGLLSSAGVGMLRYPGGSYGDIYNWQDNTAPGGYVAPGTDFDQFMGTAKAIGAQPILIANYGSGTPAEAAAWVKYANVTQGYGAKYWEIGNEIYGNGYYGDGWETDDHASKSPTTYADNVLQYASAMKAVDPTIQVGAVLTLPGNWPDGVLASGDSADWNRTVLSIAGSAIDFVIVHWYPSGSGAQAALGEPAQLTGELAQLRQEIAEYAGPRASSIHVALTEMNSNVDEDTQPDALFAADAYMTALEDGAFTVDWWDTRNGPGTISTAPDGATDFGDYGIISSGTCVGSTCEPAANTPFPTYYAISMLSKLGRPGDLMVGASTDRELVSAHAVRQANGDLAVMIVNKDPDNSYTVNLNYAGYTPSAATPTVYTYADEGTAITSARQGTSASQTIAPYSVETVVLTPQSNQFSALSAPGTPSVSQVSATGATVSWGASTGGSVTRYEVEQQYGTDSQLLAESAGTSATLQNLVPGTTYTLNVLATDQSGKLSEPSDPVTFTTTTPASSTCAVDYHLTAGWGSGYVAAVTLSDTGPNPIDGWTLTFSFPSTGETLGSGWNANWSQSGQNVEATSLSWNAQLAADGGNSQSIGFVGNNTGAYPSPAAVSLNGTVCTTTYSD